MSAYDYYEKARLIAQALRIAGFEAYAQSLLKTMAEGATATEILMITRYRLELFLDDKSLSQSIRDDVQALISRINEALK
jgi:hypothetical protein